MIGVPTEARTLTFNRSDWTGRMATVEVQDGNRFEWCRDWFELVDSTPAEQDDNPGDRGYFRSFKLRRDGDEFPLCTVFRFDGDPVWETMGAVVSRDDADPVVAACQVLAMIL